MNQIQIVKGSLQAIAQAGRTSLAEAFLGAKCIAVVDVSGSMAAQDSTQGRSRWQAACDELADLQARMPGQIALISFSDHAEFRPNGVLAAPNGSTDLTRALEFVKLADMSEMRFIVISDGKPNEPQSALRVAKTYKNRIDVIYVGPEAYPHGRDFLQELARVSGGVAVTADKVQDLAGTMQKLLGA